MRKLIPLLIFLACAAVCAWLWLPHRIHAAGPFYIDYANGSNSNPGTKTSPWKTHPYMNHSFGCDGGTPPSYQHTAGDQFIFKGGVTWPAACFPMNIMNGGSSNSVRDTYTVDQTWFALGSFTKPIFAGQNVAMDGMILISASNINLSYLDVGGWHVTTVNGNSANCDQAAIMVQPTSGGYSNITASYMYLHDWLATSAPTSLGSGDVHGITSGGMCIDQFSTYEGANVVLDHSEVSDAANMVGGQEFAFGACGMNIGIQYTHCHDLFEGIVQHASVHDSEFDHISYNPSGSGTAPAEAWNNSYNGGMGGPHTNVIESNNNEGDGPVYNNYVHSTGTYGEVIAECTQNSVYNNVVSNVSRVGIRFYQCVGDSSSSVAYAYNNTVDQSNCYNRDGSCPYSTYEYTSSSPDFDTGIVKFQNNISIGTNYSVSGLAGSVTTPNRQMTATEAATYGFTPANKYSPSSADPNTVGQGANLTASCSGNLSALCQDVSGAPWFGGSYVPRPTSSAWDLGAYVFQSGQVPPAYVSGNVNACTATSCGVSLTGTNAGDLLVLDVFVGNSTSVNLPTDTQGNNYIPIGSPQTWSSHVERLYYAKNIVGGANTTTVMLNGSTYMEVYVYEYSGLDPSSPVDVIATPTTGNGTLGMSGTVNTTHANDLLFGFFHSDMGTNMAGAGFAGRTLSNGYPLGEDRNVTSTGPYSATMSFSQSANYVGFLVAFKAASGGAGGPPAYVSGNEKHCMATSCGVSLTGTNAGDLLVLDVFVGNSTSVNLPTDTQGNNYLPIGSPQTWSAGYVERLYYAKNIAGGANTTTVTLSGSQYMELHLYEYSGLDPSSPVDVSATPTTGNGTLGTSGTVNTSHVNDLLFGFFHSDNSATNTADAGFMGRTLSGETYPLGEDRNVSTGAYSATMSFSQSANYVGFLVAFH